LILLRYYENYLIDGSSEDRLRMAKCKLCNEKGLLLPTNDDGVCEGCVEERYPYFERCCTIINENVAVLNISGDSKTLLGCCDTVLTNLKPLLEMELKGQSRALPNWPTL